MCKVPVAAGADPEPERRPKLLKARERAAGAEATASFGILHLTLSQTGTPGRVQSREQTCTGEDAGGCREAKGSGEKPLTERGGHTEHTLGSGNGDRFKMLVPRLQHSLRNELHWE